MPFVPSPQGSCVAVERLVKNSDLVSYKCNLAVLEKSSSPGPTVTFSHSATL